MGPQENDGKLGGHSNFWEDHHNFIAWINYFKFKMESKVPFSHVFPTAQKAKLYFIALPTPSVGESGQNYITTWML
jgi:hypothetical protein